VAKTTSLATRRATDWAKVAVGAISALLVYFITINHVPLYPWNNLETSQLGSTLVVAIPFAIYAVAFAVQVGWLMLIRMVHSY
jgi:hypothetical protein